MDEGQLFAHVGHHLLGRVGGRGGAQIGHQSQQRAVLLMTDRAHHRPDQLSGGQQQRVAVARALATNPKLILADEPTANLDTENGKQVMDIMARLNKETGVTFVFATHDPRVINYAKRVVTLRDGLIVENNGSSPKS